MVIGNTQAHRYSVCYAEPMLVSYITLHRLRSRFSVLYSGFLLLVACLCPLPAAASSSDAPAMPAAAATVAADQAAEYQAEVPKTIIELQQFRNTASRAIVGPGGSPGQATLVQLNPNVNAWLLLVLDWGAHGGRLSYHLENSQPREQHIRLADVRSVVITRGNSSVACDLLTAGKDSPLEQARRSSLPYAPLCGGRLFLRNPTRGNYTQLEMVTNLLRHYVWGGEKIIGFVREHFFHDAFLEKGSAGAPITASEPASSAAPLDATVSSSYAERAVKPEHLGINLDNAADGLVPGRWYSASGVAGVYVSLIQPQAIAQDILDSYRGKVSPLDPVEAAALDYLVAFDLDQFDLDYALGTEHPALGWSERTLEEMRDPNLPGPDGIDSAVPLVRTGVISPFLVPDTVATFTGGFKRMHGAFRHGPLARRNHGSHYGFVEQGVVFSKLQPGLATLYVLDDGSVDMKTWTTQDNALLPHVKYALQNGVPLADYDQASASTIPGALVSNWGAGNWSGSSDEQLRSLRAGACLQQTSNKRFLIYGYFSSATPSAIARVFQSYGCRYAMHLDMNALEHTYLALYRRKGSEVGIQHLIEGMEQVDKKAKGQLLPRFISYPDNRDFFYLTRRGKQP